MKTVVYNILVNKIAFSTRFAKTSYLVPLVLCNQKPRLDSSVKISWYWAAHWDVFMWVWGAKMYLKTKISRNFSIPIRVWKSSTEQQVILSDKLYYQIMSCCNYHTTFDIFYQPIRQHVVKDLSKWCLILCLKLSWLESRTFFRKFSFHKWLPIWTVMTQYRQINFPV